MYQPPPLSSTAENSRIHCSKPNLTHSRSLSFNLLPLTHCECPLHGLPIARCLDHYTHKMRWHLSIVSLPASLEAFLLGFSNTGFHPHPASTRPSPPTICLGSDQCCLIFPCNELAQHQPRLQNAGSASVQTSILSPNIVIHHSHTLTPHICFFGMELKQILEIWTNEASQKNENWGVDSGCPCWHGKAGSRGTLDLCCSPKTRPYALIQETATSKSFLCFPHLAPNPNPCPIKELVDFM